jgi:hypothetical protein
LFLHPKDFWGTLIELECAVLTGARFTRRGNKTLAEGLSSHALSERTGIVGAKHVRTGILCVRASTAWVQNFPPGSYQQRNCKQIHWTRRTFVAACQRADGRYSSTGLADAAATAI